MKQISSAAKTLLEGDTATFFSVKIGPYQGQYLRSTTLPYDILLGGESYQTDVILKEIDTPKISVVSDKSTFKVVLADTDGTLRQLSDTSFHGGELEVRCWFLNTTGSTLGGAAHLQPLVNIEDSLLVYKGRCDEMTFNLTEDASETTLTIAGASPVSALDLTRRVITSKEWLRARHPSDSSFDSVFSGSASVTRKWGKV
jgi:hypothetical protein